VSAGERSVSGARIRALVVDDEPLARRGIRARLAHADGFDVVGECDSGPAAVEVIRRDAPDLVFLDVQMPGLDGFGVVQQVGVDRMPMVVFVTAYDAHALRAFEVHALDYLLKPIDDERFARAVDRARQAVAERRDGALGRRLSAMLAEWAGERGSRGHEVPDGAARPAAALARYGARVLVKDRGRVVLLDEDEVDWIEADGDYVRVHARGKGHLVRETLTAAAARLTGLTGSRFVRIHRSAIVNVGRIRELRPLPNRDYVVVLRDGTQLKLSRSYSDGLRAVLGDAL
jgi:two-component system, LytTR family, response regulator